MLNASAIAAVSPILCPEPTSQLKGMSSDAAQGCERPISSKEEGGGITYKKKSSEKHWKHGLQDV